MIPISEWKWSGRPGHFISRARCRYHITTVVGDYLISTLGDYHQRHKSPPETINIDSYYETMVFKHPKVMECGCYNANGREIEVKHYKGDYDQIKCSDLDQGHFDMCMKYAEMQEV